VANSLRRRRRSRRRRRNRSAFLTSIGSRVQWKEDSFPFYGYKVWKDGNKMTTNFGHVCHVVSMVGSAQLK